jgi:hypothetical protein
MQMTFTIPDDLAQRLQQLFNPDEFITQVIRTALPPLNLPPPQRQPGLGKGGIWMSEDFDEPLPDEFWFSQEECL